MVVDCVQLPYSSAHPAQTLFSIEECYLYKLIIRLSVPTNCRKWLTADSGSVAAIYFLMLIDLIQQTDKLLFEGHAIVGSRHASTATYRRIRRTVIHMTENFSKNPPVNCR